MNSVLSSLSRLSLRPQLPQDVLRVPVRHASKKASGGTRNKPQAKGQHYGLKKTDGCYVYKNDVIATQNRLRWHGGLNVAVQGHFRLVALTEGRVIFTCEKPDLDWTHSWNQKFYAGREGVPFYKKYVHVIPRPMHNRFKVIQQV